MKTGTDRTSFAILVKEHHRGLLAYARALTKEEHTSRDIVQDAFVVAWRNLDTFDVTRDFGSWMRGIVRNKWRESLRKSARVIALDDETLEYFEADARQWDGLRDHGGVFTRLELCLKKLPESLADAVKAFYYDEQSGEDAARKLNVQSATLRKRLERARSGLRDCLKGA
ncbi:MAG: sigma-70 family RNA polymerase sigma factor [Verrucomicrobiae bacterium]|nr:sigma-70 family RNA polymerase sigma factor [Verrucomicrobiae bacterium]NNJ43723.1 sigma-70 family RNA polymerase sigma factor [Akkermansiaceae bacterium]